MGPGMHRMQRDSARRGSVLGGQLGADQLQPQRDAWKCIGTDMKSCVTVARNDHRADNDDDDDDDDDDDGVNDKTSHDMHEA